MHVQLHGSAGLGLKKKSFAIFFIFSPVAVLRISILWLNCENSDISCTRGCFCEINKPTFLMCPKGKVFTSLGKVL